MWLAALALGWTLAGGADEGSAAQFLAALQAASDRNDRAAISAMVEYPIGVVVSGWMDRTDSATGDYLIDVVRTAPPGEAVLTYWLTISVR